MALIKKVLWLDFLLGSSTGIVGLLFFQSLSSLLGLPDSFIVIVSVVNLLYAGVACSLALQKEVSKDRLNILINANWFWTAVSIVLLIIYFMEAAFLGRAFLILQILVVGGLAYWERTLTK